MLTGVGNKSKGAGPLLSNSGSAIRLNDARAKRMSWKSDYRFSEKDMRRNKMDGALKCKPSP